MVNQRQLKGGGRLIINECQGRIHLCATRTTDNRGLYKVWLFGQSGRMLLGTMIPEGGELRLERTLSRNTLLACGCYPILGGEVVMAFSFRHGEQSRPQALPKGWNIQVENTVFCNDPLLQEIISKQSWIEKSENHIFYLGMAYKIGVEFPLLPLFCFAKWEKLDENSYLIWKFDDKRQPIKWDNS